MQVLLCGPIFNPRQKFLEMNRDCLGADMPFAKMTINPVIYQYSKEIATKQIYTVQYSDTLCATIDDTF